MNPKSSTRFPIIVMALALAALTSCGGGGGGNGYTMAPAPKEMNSPDFGNGGSYVHTFAAAGTYNYHCIHHGAMTGSVVVDVSAPGTTATVNIVSSSTPFPAASVKPGGTVTWNNNSGAVHTVTSN
jgi:plastocyanin